MRYVVYFSEKITPSDIKIKKVNADNLTDKQLKQINSICNQTEKLHRNWNGEFGLRMPDTNDDVTRTWIKNRGPVFLCAMDKDNNVIGYAAAGKKSMFKDTCWLSDISVDESARGMGIGKRLVRETLKELKSKGHHNVMLNVSLQNKPALSLYEKTGFRPWEYTMVNNL